MALTDAHLDDIGPCLSPPRLETMMANGGTPNEVSTGELYRSMVGIRDDLKDDIGEVKAQLGNVVYRDVYEADRRAFQEQNNALREALGAAEAQAATATRLAMWAVGIFLAGILGAIVVAVVSAID